MESWQLQLLCILFCFLYSFCSVIFWYISNTNDRHQEHVDALNKQCQSYDKSYGTGAEGRGGGGGVGKTGG